MFTREYLRSLHERCSKRVGQRKIQKDVNLKKPKNVAIKEKLNREKNKAQQSTETLRNSADCVLKAREQQHR